MESNYTKYRGKCKEFCDAELLKDPSLTLVRGHYYCPIANTKEQHWWLKRTDGSIFDPTRLQFLSGGAGEYIEFNGYVECAQCGIEILEDVARFESRYAFCSGSCHMRFVGL